MPDQFTVLELLLMLACFVITANELFGIVRARQQGLSKNVSRVFTHASMLILLLVYAYFAYSYLPAETVMSGINTFGTPTLNLTYLLIGLVVTALAAWESVGIMRARSQGLTRNVSRLVSHTTVLLMLLVMMGLSSIKWDHYIERLEASYQSGIPVAYSAD